MQVGKRSARHWREHQAPASKAAGGRGTTSTTAQDTLQPGDRAADQGELPLHRQREVLGHASQFSHQCHYQILDKGVS